MFNSEATIRVRYQETDQMGIAYHSNYFIWFEVGRTEYFRQLGLTYKEFEKNNIYLPVIKVQAEFKNPSYYDDVLRVITWIEYLHEVRLSFSYQIRREEELLAEGTTGHAFVNQQGKPVILKKKNPFLWKRLLEITGNDEK